MFVACHSEVGRPARSGMSAVLFPEWTVTYMMARWITGVADDGRRKMMTSPKSPYVEDPLARPSRYVTTSARVGAACWNNMSPLSVTPRDRSWIECCIDEL